MYYTCNRSKLIIEILLRCVLKMVLHNLFILFFFCNVISGPRLVLSSDYDADVFVENEPPEYEILTEDETLPDLEPSEPTPQWPTEMHFDKDPKNWPGHQKPLASESPVLSVDKLKSFPPQKLFIDDYLQQRVPLQIIDPFKDSKIREWSKDHFFTSSAFAALKRFNVTTINGETKEISLREYFNRKSWDSKLEFETGIPDFMRLELPIPQSLQCKEILEEIQTAKLRGTVSPRTVFIKNSELDRLLCTLKGSSSVHLADNSQVQRDSNFSADLSNLPATINFESVDLQKFPALRFAKFIKADLRPTDCLFVPSTYWQFHSTSNDYLEAEINWIHKKIDAPLKTCENLPGIASFGLIKLKDEPELDLQTILTMAPLQHLFLGVGQKNFTFDQLENWLKKDKKILHKMTEWNEEYSEICVELFTLLDINRDSVFSTGDLDALKKEDQNLFLGRLQDRMQDFADIMNDQHGDSISAPSAGNAGSQPMSPETKAYLDKYTEDIKKLIDDALKKAEELKGLEDRENARGAKATGSTHTISEGSLDREEKEVLTENDSAVDSMQTDRNSKTKEEL